MSKGALSGGIAITVLLTSVLVGCAKGKSAKPSVHPSDNGPKANPKIAIDTRAIDAMIGKKAPDWTLDDTTGKVWKLADLKGKIVVLHSWATWCIPCKQAMPGIDNVYKEFHDRGLCCFGITNQGPEADADIKKTLDTYKFSFPTLWHAGAVIGEGAPYPIPVWPTMYIIDRKGVIRFVHPAGINEKVLRDDLEKLGFE